MKTSPNIEASEKMDDVEEGCEMEATMTDATTGRYPRDAKAAASKLQHGGCASSAAVHQSQTRDPFRYISPQLSFPSTIFISSHTS